MGKGDTSIVRHPMYLRNRFGEAYINPKWSDLRREARIPISNLYSMSKEREEEEEKDTIIGKE